MRWPGYWMMVTISLLHCSLFIERLIATRFTHVYEQCGNSLGIWLCLFVWLITIGVNVATYSVEWSEYFGYNSYCLGVVSDLNELRVRILLLCLLIFDLSATGGEWFLTLKNRRDKVFINYSLSRAYQQGENYLTVRLVTPISLLHSILFTLFLMIHISVREFIIYNDGPIRYVACILMSHNMLVFSLTISLAVYINRVHWTKKQKELRGSSIVRQDQATVYFNQLQSQLL
ncbi:unnamed protein product [Bursaphelenchus xylophilus]|nr:unnamed protein product [Bursaphelenchus xylophilus]CAG9117123.1 unnamed protein product [Bursaphelenchus xylophilus]